MTDHNAATRVHQEASLLQAENWGQPWMAHEIELLREDSPAHELAEVLARTVYAVQTARYLLAQGATLGGGHGRKPARAARPSCPCHGLEVLPSGTCALD